MKRFTLGTISIVLFSTEEEANTYYRDTVWTELSNTIHINSRNNVDLCLDISCTYNCPIGPDCRVTKHINIFKKFKEN